jgi:uncharacterized membrane protein YfcA
VPEALILAALFFGAAVLYSSVGHAGASAYLAAMALVGVSPLVARPTALALNILVASLVLARFWRGGHVSARALVPFLIGSIPFAFIGGAIQLPTTIYKPLLGAVLIVAGAQFARTARQISESELSETRVPLVWGIMAGAAIGLLSGLTGTGGGIFLTPLLLLAGWSATRPASGISAGFILANSISGLAGNAASVGSLPPELPFWAAAVLLGALIGSELGSRRAPTTRLRQALALVLVIAGLKLIFLG